LQARIPVDADFVQVSSTTEGDKNGLICSYYTTDCAHAVDGK